MDRMDRHSPVCKFVLLETAGRLAASAGARGPALGRVWGDYSCAPSRSCERHRSRSGDLFIAHFRSENGSPGHARLMVGCRKPFRKLNTSEGRVAQLAEQVTLNH